MRFSRNIYCKVGKKPRSVSQYDFTITSYECHIVSNHRPFSCLLNKETKKNPHFRSFVRGAHRQQGKSPPKGTVTRFFPFYDVIMASLEENASNIIYLYVICIATIQYLNLLWCETSYEICTTPGTWSPRCTRCISSKGFPHAPFYCDLSCPTVTEMLPRISHTRDIFPLKQNNALMDSPENPLKQNNTLMDSPENVSKHNGYKR